MKPICYGRCFNLPQDIELNLASVVTRVPRGSLLRSEDVYRRADLARDPLDYIVREGTIEEDRRLAGVDAIRREILGIAA